MLDLKRYRTKRKAFADLLNFAAVVEDGIVLNKDGSLMAGWFYRGSDISSSTAAERNAISRRLNDAMVRLGSGWTTHVDAVRFPATEYPAESRSFFPDPVSRLIDNERRGQFETEGRHYESMYALVATYNPPLFVRKGISKLVYDDPDAGQTGDATRILDTFKLQLADFEDALGSVLELRRMRGVPYVDKFGEKHTNDEFLQYLNYVVTGHNHPVNLPPCPMYLDAVIGGGEFLHGLVPKHDRKHVSVVSIDGFPKHSAANLLSELDQLPIDYRWSTRFIYNDREGSRKQIEKYRVNWSKQTRSLIDQILNRPSTRFNQDAVDRVDETDAAKTRVDGGETTYGYYTSVVVLMSEDKARLEEHTRYVAKVIGNLGFKSRIETFNRTEAFLGSIPGHTVENVRRPLLSTRNHADLLPTASIWPGSAVCPCPFYPPDSPPLLHAATVGTTPFRFNFHVGDVGHTLIFGPTGAGKSVLLGILAAQFRRYLKARIFAFDKGRSMYALTKACGGNHYELAGDDSTNHTALTPLAEIDTEADRLWAEEWIATCLELQMGVGTLTPANRNEVTLAMKRLQKAPREKRTLTAFAANLMDKRLREALEFYTLSGAAPMLDHEEESFGDTDFETFEIEELMALGDKVVIPVLLYLFRRIHRSLKGQPALLILDEAWLMLSHAVFREKIREWLKVLRKANCAVILATQSLSDAVRSEILDVLMEQCMTKILLPNDQANTGGDTVIPGVLTPRQLYEMMGLNATQLGLLVDATPKRDYYYLSPLGRRMFELNLGPIALAFVGASSKADISRIRELERTHGKNWPQEWLRVRGVAVPAGAFGPN